MRLVGRDYIFKLMSQDFVTSLFDVRKRYFLGGMPREISKNKTAFFVAKFKKSETFKEYTLVGEGHIRDVNKVIPLDKDYSFSIQNGWGFVMDFDDLMRYPKVIPVANVLSESVLKKLNGQRPFGVELQPEESRSIKSKIQQLLI